MKDDKAVVQFRNISKPEEISDRIQLDASASPIILKELLNSILGNTNTYLFYYSGERINSDLASIISKFNCNLENTMVIDYLDPRDQEPDSSIELDDAITRLVFYKNKIYTSQFLGNVRVFEKTLENKEEIISGQFYNNIAADKFIYGASKTCIKNLVNSETLYEASSEIKFLETSNLYVAIGTLNRHIFVYQSEIKKIVEDITIENPFRGLFVTDDFLYWLESVDTIAKYDFLTQKVLYSSVQQSVTAFKVSESIVYCATSDGILVKIESNKPKKIQISMHFVENLQIYEDFIILSSQKEILILNKDSMQEKAFLTYESQINSFVAADGMLYIACGENLISYAISRLIK